MYRNSSTKTYNSFRNTIWGVVLKLIGLLLPFVTRTLLIHYLGAEYLGLNSLFTSLLQILSLSELGIGGAMVYYMYEPFAKGDTSKLCALLSLYRKLYNYIGIIITVLGLILFPFLDYFIDGETPSDVNISVLYLIYLFNTSISYFLFSYRRSLFIANQRSDIESKSLIAANCLMYIGQICGIMIFNNYYIYTIAIPISTIFNNIYIYIASRKFYPEIKCKGFLDHYIKSEMIKKIKALFGHKVGGVITTSISNIVVSSFLGLTILAIYNNYYYIVLLLGGFIDIFFNSIRASVGFSMVENDRSKNLANFQFIQFINCWCTSFFAICYICLIQPFMQIWVGKSLMFNMETVILFTILLYIWNIRKVNLVYKDAIGNWEIDMLKPYIESAINFFMSILLAKYIGVNGVIISSIICMLFIDFPWEIYAVNKISFHTSWWTLIKDGIYVSIVFIILTPIMLFLLEQFNSQDWTTFIPKVLACMLIPNIIFIMVFIKSPYLKRLFSIIHK